MSVGNGSVHEALHRIADVEDDAIEERQFVREQFKLLREKLNHLTEMQKYTNETLDTLLRMAQVQEKRDEAEDA